MRISSCTAQVCIVGDGCWTQGITNCIGAIPGVLGVALVGVILDRTHSWTVSNNAKIFNIIMIELELVTSRSSPVMNFLLLHTTSKR
jgi:hypothetical protein